MRLATLIGFHLAALTLDGAAAEPILGCGLDGLELTTHAAGSPGSRRFRILKVESHFWRLHGPEVNDLKPDGYVKVLIEGGGRRYVIELTYSRYGMPANCGVAADATPESVR